MKFKLNIAILSMAVLLTAAGARAQTTYYTNSYSQTVNTIIPDDNPNGLAATIQVSGAIGNISSLSVGLDVTNGFSGDYYAYLVDPNGDFAVLLNRSGVTATNPFGYADSGYDMTFSSTALNDIHFYQSFAYSLNGAGQLTGTWAPDGRDIDPESAPSAFDTAGTGADFGSFLGNSADGTWTLFIADESGGYEGSLANWNLTVVTVPEPGTGAYLVVAGVAWWAWLRRRR